MFPILSPQPIFTPKNLYGLKLWLDATQTPVGAVSSWADQSGNGNNATQGTGANQPVCTTNQQNGNNAVLFDGINDSLSMSSALFTVPTGDNTTFAVAKITATTGGSQFVLSYIQSGVATRSSLVFPNVAGQILFNNNNNSGNIISTGNLTTNFNIINALRLGVAQSLSINNGAAVSNNNATSVTPINVGIIGSTEGSGFFAGAMAEIIIYNRALSSAEIIAINRYLSQKWGITIS